MNGDTDSDEDWVGRLYQPRFKLDTFLQKALGFDNKVDAETQANLGPCHENIVHRATQTDESMWCGQDLELLRRAYNRKIQDLTLDSSPQYNCLVRDLQVELEEMRENWRGAQLELDKAQSELAAERKESQRLRIAITGLKRFSSVQLAEADDARWMAQFERASAQRAFSARLDEQRLQERLYKAEKQAVVQKPARPPSFLDMTTVYRLLEEAKQENSRLQGDLDRAVSAVGEYESAYQMLLRHMNRSHIKS